MEAIAINQIRPLLTEMAEAADDYFAGLKTSLAGRPKKPETELDWLDLGDEAENLWDAMSDGQRDQGRALITKSLSMCAALAGAVKRSPLAGPEDTQAVKFAAKAIRASLQLHRYSYRPGDVVHDEGSILGYRPPEQHEYPVPSVEEAQVEFANRVNELTRLLRLIEAGHDEAPQQFLDSPQTNKYRAGTAFIMMWMDPAHPELTDVADQVKGVFEGFGVRAVRADDIEHDGLISEKVLNEIRSAEFLFADLTGSRPNVYYEVGYAHALGKRVILFRKAGTNMHFDLAGYNCPPYENLRDLKEKLSKRLESMTNRSLQA